MEFVDISEFMGNINTISKDKFKGIFYVGRLQLELKNSIQSNGYMVYI